MGKKRSRRKRGGNGKPRPAVHAAALQGGAARDEETPFALPPAMRHYLRVMNEPPVRALLAHVGAAGLGRDRPMGWPGTQPLVAALARAGEDSDANLALLFGSAEHVRRTHEEVRMHMRFAQPGSPADLAGMGPSALPVGLGHEPWHTTGVPPYDYRSALRHSRSDATGASPNTHGTYPPGCSVSWSDNPDEHWVVDSVALKAENRFGIPVDINDVGPPQPNILALPRCQPLIFNG